jgi:hypothetical protein
MQLMLEVAGGVVIGGLVLALLYAMREEIERVLGWVLLGGVSAIVFDVWAWVALPEIRESSVWVWVFTTVAVAVTVPIVCKEFFDFVEAMMGDRNRR